MAKKSLIPCKFITTKGGKEVRLSYDDMRQFLFDNPELWMSASARKIGTGKAQASLGGRESLSSVEATAKALEEVSTFDQQDANAETIVGKQKDRWGRSQVWRERIENAGDILREISGRGKNPDVKYLEEKIDKIKNEYHHVWTKYINE